MEIIDIIYTYLKSLDWFYIITLILLSSILVKDKRLSMIPEIPIKTALLNVRKGWRVVVIGIAYGTLLYWIRGLGKKDIELLIQSLIFALVFHELLIKSLIRVITSWYDKSDIARH
jgi:hypothetical protein